MGRSRRISKEVVSVTGVTVDSCYCRKCMENKKPSEFYSATDLFLDSNGFMSICKDCIKLIYDGFYRTTQSIEGTILRVCRLLNVRYEEAAVEALLNHLQTLEEKGKKEPDSIFGIYKNKIIGVQKTRISEKGNDYTDLTFEEPSQSVIDNLPREPMDDMEEYIRAWGGDGELKMEDYLFLEQEFAKWKRTTKCDTQGEEVLVREICHKQNEIRKARIEGKGTDNLVKGLQEIMKNSALTPALQNSASSGKNADTFGVWIKQIEKMTPAEWFDEQEKFRDMDGIEKDKEDINRSIGNFITGSRDFTTTDLENITGEEGELGLLDDFVEEE